MVSAPPPRRSLPETEPKGSFRLRHLLGVLILGGFASWIYPKGVAAWQLHNLAVTYADYGLCMVGPTGPDLLREHPERFIELARRRVLMAAPDDRPFQDCFPLVSKMPVRHAALRLHTLAAKDFLEYHHTPFATGRASVDEFEADVSPLDDLANAAWPFVRSGAAKLMKPSSHAREAAHPASPVVPGWGTGLPDRRFRYRSTAAFGDTFVTALGSGANAEVLMSKNQGQDWRPGGRELAADLRDRCVANEEGRAFTLSRLNDGRHIVLSHGPGSAPQISVLASSDLKIAGVSCDVFGLVAALVEEPDATGYRPVQLRHCPFRKACEDLQPPDLAGARLYYPADVARIDGDIVVSRSSGGITRVASSRDDGRTWAPWIVAFDAVSAQIQQSPPFRLLVAADLVLLYSGAPDQQRYPLLISADHGASFTAPSFRPETADRAVAQLP